MNSTHVAGGGLGTVVGAVVVGLLHRFAHVDTSGVDAVVVGSAALAAGVGLAHAVGKFGLVGCLRILVHGVPAPVPAPAPKVVIPVQQSGSSVVAP